MRARRIMDIGLALLLGLLLGPVLLLLVGAQLVLAGRPVFYLSERMQAPGRPFTLVKLRTMAADPADSGVSGGDKAARITPFGAFLRRCRADEIPQLWNILKGDMGFVGPRPPLRLYVERFPELYARVLRDRPGVTGLATLVYHRHEERLLARCGSAAETDLVYSRHCVPRKAQLDLLYQKKRTLCSDFMLILRTAGFSVGQIGRRHRPSSADRGAPPAPPAAKDA